MIFHVSVCLLAHEEKGLLLVPSRFVRKFICRLRLNEVSRQ